MADRLTQLQDCLDDLLMQMFATLNYIQTRHPYGSIPGQPDQAPSNEISDERGTAEPATALLNGEAHDRQIEAVSGTAIKSEPLTPSADATDVFTNALRELARDLIVQEQKAELLINSLPGMRNSERDQKRRMQELEAELKQVDIARVTAETEKAALLKNLNQLIVDIRRVR